MNRKLSHEHFETVVSEAHNAKILSQREKTAAEQVQSLLKRKHLETIAQGQREVLAPILNNFKTAAGYLLSQGHKPNEKGCVVKKMDDYCQIKAWKILPMWYVSHTKLSSVIESKGEETISSSYFTLGLTANGNLYDMIDGGGNTIYSGLLKNLCYGDPKKMPVSHNGPVGSGIGIDAVGELNTYLHRDPNANTWDELIEAFVIKTAVDK